MLEAGDLMFVGFDSDNDDVAMVATTFIAGGEVLYFTDNEWDGTEFLGNEQLIEWVVPAGGIPAGTVILFDTDGATIDAGGSLNYVTDNGSLAGGNEMFWIVQGTVDENNDLIPNNFVAVIGNEADGTDTQTPNLTNTGLTTTNGAIIIDGDNDYMEFVGDEDLPDPATPEQLIAAISDLDQWETANGGGNSNPNGSGWDLDFPDVICFTSGTYIRTPSGNRLVQDLKAGDQVITADDGVQTILWVGKRCLCTQHLQKYPHLKPILIRKHTFGKNCPNADMLVSPQHQMHIKSATAQVLFATREVLAPAKSLINETSISISATTDVEYIHIMFDKHQLIYADNTLSESFYPGQQALGTLENRVRDELLELFPDLRAWPNNFGPKARLSLKPYEAKLLSPTAL